MPLTIATSDCSPIIIASENDTNITGKISGSDYLDMHTDIAIKISFVFVSAVLVTFSSLALIALARTSSIPKNACILSSSLLMFDCAATFTFALRNIITEHVILNLITLVGLGWCNASSVNIAVMCIDRAILFQWPYFYVRRFTNGSYVIIYYIIILAYLLSFTGQWIKCFIGRLSFWEVRQCMNPVIVENLTISFVTSIAVSIPCFVLIVIIIIKQRRRERTRSRRESRSTIVVFVCFVNYACTVSVFLILMYTHCYVSIIARRTAIDIVFIINGFVDTCVYVLWFKECRYELLKILGKILPPLKTKVERMRTEVFDISTGTNIAM